MTSETTVKKLFWEIKTILQVVKIFPLSSAAYGCIIPETELGFED